MTCKEMIIKYLKDNGFNGLHTDSCGCGLDDLMPCCDEIWACEAAYKIKCKTCGKTLYASTKEDFDECDYCLD